MSTLAYIIAASTVQRSHAEEFEESKERPLPSEVKKESQPFGNRELTVDVDTGIVKLARDVVSPKLAMPGELATIHSKDMLVLECMLIWQPRCPMRDFDRTYLQGRSYLGS